MSKLIPSVCIILSFALGWFAHTKYDEFQSPVPQVDCTVQIPHGDPEPEYPPLDGGAINDLR
jgi:hypothetical protein